MSARLVSSCLGLYAPLPPSSPAASRFLNTRLAAAFQVFNGISPLVKFSHFTANQAIQEAFEREDRVHIIDLDIMQGLQWPGLFHILASRPGGPPRVRLTGLGASMDALNATGKRLSDFADTLGLPFEFNAVAEKAGNVDPEKLLMGGWRRAPRGSCRPLAPPLALRCQRLRRQHALPHPKAGPQGGDNGGAGPEPLGLLPGTLRRGHPLLLGALRLA
ncbi:unnamed protein product [Urochloa humidicola]